MILRLLGLAVTFACIGYLFYIINHGGESAVEHSSVLQAEKQSLQDMGINAADKEALQKYAVEKAKEIESYQAQLNEKAN